MLCTKLLSCQEKLLRIDKITIFNAEHYDLQLHGRGKTLLWVPIDLGSSFMSHHVLARSTPFVE